MYYHQRDTILFRVDIHDAKKKKLLFALEPVGALAAAPLPAIEMLSERVVVALLSHVSPPSEEQLQVPPTRLSCPPPAYPESLFRANIEGEVLAGVLVNAMGWVDSVRIVMSTHSAFEKPTRDMLMGCRYRPGRLPSGRPSPVWIQFPVVFRLAAKPN